MRTDAFPAVRSPFHTGVRRELHLRLLASSDPRAFTSCLETSSTSTHYDVSTPARWHPFMPEQSHTIMTRDPLVLNRFLLDDRRLHAHVNRFVPHQLDH